MGLAQYLNQSLTLERRRGTEQSGAELAASRPNADRGDRGEC